MSCSKKLKIPKGKAFSGGFPFPAICRETVNNPPQFSSLNTEDFENFFSNPRQNPFEIYLNPKTGFFFKFRKAPLRKKSWAPLYFGKNFPPPGKKRCFCEKVSQTPQKNVVSPPPPQKKKGGIFFFSTQTNFFWKFFPRGLRKTHTKGSPTPGGR